MDFGKKRQLLLFASRWPKYGELQNDKNSFDLFSPSACGLRRKKNEKSFCHPSVPPSFGISCQIKSTFFFSYVHTIFFQRWIEFFQLTRLLLYRNQHISHVSICISIVQDTTTCFILRIFRCLWTICDLLCAIWQKIWMEWKLWTICNLLCAFW